MKCPGCGNEHEEIGRHFLVKYGPEDWHQKCWDKEVSNNG